MVCPYAKVTGLLKKRVTCQLVESEVDFTKYPCVKGNFKECPIYLEKVSKKKPREEVIAPKEDEAVSQEPLERMVNEAVTNAKKFYDPKKGEKPPTCYDCLYFSPTTKMCILLKKKIKNPEKPECY